MSGKSGLQTDLDLVIDKTTPNKYKFNTLPLPRKHRNKHRNSDASGDRVTRKKSFVDMAKRKISRGNKAEQPPPPVETPKKVGVDKDVDKLKGSEKAVLTALKWFLDVVQKETLIMLPGSTTKVLQAIMELNTTLSSCVKQEESSALSSRHSQVYQSLANLIHWADKIVLYGQSVMDKAQGTEVTSAVQNGIEELVKLSIEKLKLQDKNRNEVSTTSPTTATPTSSSPGRQSPVVTSITTPDQLSHQKPQGLPQQPFHTGSTHSLSSSSSSPASPHSSPKAHNANCNANRQQPEAVGSLIIERPLSPREKEVLYKSPISPWTQTQSGHQVVDLGRGRISPSSAPPKPPLPEQRQLFTDSLSVPPLPPKRGSKRSSLYDNTSDDGSFISGSGLNNNHHPGMRRSFSGSSMSMTSQSDLSTSSTHSRPNSMYSTQLSSVGQSDDWDTSTTATEQSFDTSRLSVLSEPMPSPAMKPINQRVHSYSMCESINYRHQQQTMMTTFVNGSGAFASESSSGGESSTPPPPLLPAKTRPRTVRQLSAYDGLNEDEAAALSMRLQERARNSQDIDHLSKQVEEVFDLEEGHASQPDVVKCATPHKGIAQFDSSGDIALRQDSEGPPPLPPKTNKHINTYLGLVGGYSNEGVELSFPQGCASTHMLAYNANFHASPYEYMQRREEFFQKSYLMESPIATVATSDVGSSCSSSSLSTRGSFPQQLVTYQHQAQHQHRHQQVIEVHGSPVPIGNNVNNSIISSNSSNSRGYETGYETGSIGYDTTSQGSHDSDELPPALPPKKKDSLTQVQNADIQRLRHNTNPERPCMPIYDLKKKSDSMIENGSQPTCIPHNGSQPPLPGRSMSEAESEHEENFSDSGILDMIDVNELLSWSTEEEGNPVKGGPVESLIVYAADADRKDLVYYEAFLQTYRMFINSRDLLNKLLYRYKRFRHKGDMKSKRANRNAFFLLLRVSGDLIGQTEDDILEMLMELVFQLLCDGELMLAKILRDKVLTKIANNKKATTTGQHLWDVGISTTRPSIHDVTSQEIAEQMTILDSELFQKIEIPEVLMWAKEQSEALSPNLTIFTEHFNKMSYWVRSLILQESKPQDREKLLNKFVRVMKYLRKLNNFNSYLAVLSALDSAPVRRLEWQRQTVEGLKEYCTLIDSSSSFRCYRAALAEAEPPCIPYLGLILQDITFVHIGNPEDLPDNGGVNFVKCWQYFNILDSMRRFKQHHYDTLKKDEKVLRVFNDFSEYLDEEAMWQLSKVLKP